MSQTMVTIKVGGFELSGRLEQERAPLTCDAFQKLLPFRCRMVHARWSGESGFIPLDSLDLGVGLENATSYPAPGEVLWHPPGVSEAEILFPYGPTRFASKVGQLAGSHFLTIMAGREALVAIGQALLQQGAQDVVFSSAQPTPAAGAGRGE